MFKIVIGTLLNIFVIIGLREQNRKLIEIENLCNMYCTAK